MSIKINGTDVVDNNRKGIFQSANVGAFANPARPGSAATGDLIYSTTDSKLQVWNGSAWVAAGGGAEISATGGTKTTSADGFYFIHTFTSPGTFTLSTNGALIDYFLIGGGGSGGVGGPPTLPFSSNVGGGGGAGGHILEYSRVWASGSYSVAVGSGGGPAGPAPAYPAGNNGNPTTLQCPPTISAPGTLTALGGGGGGGGPRSVPFHGPPPSNARQGGCGGGGFWSPGSPGPSPSIPNTSGADPSDSTQGGNGNGGGYGSNGGPYSPSSSWSGGGGGIGGRGYNSGVPASDASRSLSRGVDGLYLNWASPTKTYYGGGGNGGPIMATPYSPAYPGPRSPSPDNAKGTLAANTGGGGYGWADSSPGNTNPASSGNSGIVIIRYAKVQNL